MEINIGKIVKWVIGILLALIVILNSFTVIPYGNVGVKRTMGKLDNVTMGEGPHFKIPFIQSIIKVNVQVDKAEADASASSKDLQPVKTHIVVNYRVDGASAYGLLLNVGKGYESKIIDPSIHEITKEVTARYSAEQLISKREIVAGEIRDGLMKRLGRYDLKVAEISIKNFDFSDSFNASIEAKQVAAQKAMQAENDLRRIEVEAQQKIAGARAEAESLRLKKQEVTPELVRLKEIEVQEKALEKWDGKLPQVTGGATPFISITGAGK